MESTTKVTNHNKYNLVSVGERVRIMHAPRVSDRHLVGQIGCVTNQTNAGFRGIEHTVVVTDCGRRYHVHGVGAADLEVIR
jgi:hypothetical protein